MTSFTSEISSTKETRWEVTAIRKVWNLNLENKMMYSYGNKIFKMLKVMTGCLRESHVSSGSIVLWWLSTATIIKVAFSKISLNIIQQFCANLLPHEFQSTAIFCCCVVLWIVHQLNQILSSCITTNKIIFERFPKLCSQQSSDPKFVTDECTWNMNRVTMNTLSIYSLIAELLQTAISINIVGSKHEPYATRPNGGLGTHLNFAYQHRGNLQDLTFAHEVFPFHLHETFLCSLCFAITWFWVRKWLKVHCLQMSKEKQGTQIHDSNIVKSH